MKTKSLFDAEGALEAPSAEVLDVILNAPYVAVAWLGVADRCDVESLTGMDKITLEWEVSRRAELVGKITERLNNCEKWLGMVG